MNQIEQMQEWIDHHSGRADRAESINAELLEAIRELVVFAGNYCDGHTPGCKGCIVVQNARAAIAKATGGAK